VKFEDLYYPELTTAVFGELKRVGSWFNRFLGFHPTLVGGWAVFQYNPSGLGSRDVDLIFPDRQNKDRTVNLYMLTNGYQRAKRIRVRRAVRSGCQYPQGPRACVLGCLDRGRREPGP
jgi:hypothetical protein